MKKLIKFSTPTCQPCQQLSPIFHKVKNQFPQIQFEEVDCTKDQDAVKTYGIRGVPTLILVEEGEIMKRNVGLISERELIDFLKD